MGKRRTENTRFNFPEISDQETEFFVDDEADVPAAEESAVEDRAEASAATR
jgi:hypothetical protein